MDRIDIHVEVPGVPYRDLVSQQEATTSADIRERTNRARAIQSERLRRTKVHCNAQMNNRQIRRYCSVDRDSHRLLEVAIDKLGLSARAYNRILRIGRTIADLERAEKIGTNHVSEAIQYRSLDRGTIFGWQ
jgi:magnesium chelatase family protein